MMVYFVILKLILVNVECMCLNWVIVVGYKVSCWCVFFVSLIFKVIFIFFWIVVMLLYDIVI